MSQKVYIEVAVDSAVRQTFTYSWDSELMLGQRVMIPFGKANKPIRGTTLLCHYDTPSFMVKNIIGVLDDEPTLSGNMIRLGRWLSDYYLYPLGLVFKTMLAVHDKENPLKWVLTDLGLKLWEDKSADEHSLIKFLFPRRVPVKHITLEKRLKDHNLVKLDELISKKVIHQEGSVSWKASGDSREIRDEGSGGSNKELTEEQYKAVSIISASFDSGVRRPVLLWGVTGSGKTEVYLRVIENVFQSDRSAQAVVLVPEISLTPQMTRVFDRYFPGDVVTVHSNMDNKSRLDNLNRIRQGKSRILLGPRSAILAIFDNLKLIIVDEEHDSSYKQESGLHYNGRDVAILRGQIESAQVVLGSATPSLESYGNYRSGKYDLIRMNQRVHKRPLPKIELVKSDTKKCSSFLNSSLSSVVPTLSSQVKDALEKNLELGQQSIVIVNRKGYAHFVLSLRDRTPLVCPDCSVSLTVYSHQDLLKCHYCGFVRPIRPLIESSNKYVIVGCGSEQLEKHIERALPEARIARVDSNSVGKAGSLEKTLAKFRDGEIDILVGTQILAKGHDFPNVTLICLLEIDQMLNFPDFRAGERLIQLVIQAAGRAGRGKLKGRVLLQSQRDSDPVIQFAMDQDYSSFLDQELELRKHNGFPPYQKIICFEYSCAADKELLDLEMGRLTKILERLLESRQDLLEHTSFLGPSAPPIEKVRGRFRKFLLIVSASTKNAWPIADWLQQQSLLLSSKIRVVVNVDPHNLF